MKRLVALFLALLVTGHISHVAAQNGGTAFVVPGGSAAGGSATNAQPPSAVLTNLATLGINTTNCVWVSTTGNDATAARNRIDLPAQTPAKASTLALPGDTVCVLPGTYYNASNLLARGVNWLGFNQPVLTFTNTTNAGRGWGMFDDRFTGSTTSRVENFKLLWCGGLPGTNSDGSIRDGSMPTNTFAGVMITNPATRVTFDLVDFDYALLQSYTQATVAAIYVKNCTNVTYRNGYVNDLFFTNGFLVGLDEFSENVIAASVGTGLYWEAGETYFIAPEVTGAAYSVYGAGSATTTGNIWITCDRIRGRYYFQGNGAPAAWKSWGIAKSIDGGANGASFYSGGRHYLTVEKLEGTTLGLAMSTGVEVWLNAQKLTSGSAAFANFIDVPGGTLHATVMQFEDLGLVQYGLRVRDNGVATIFGGTMTVSNGIGAKIESGYMTLRDMTIKTTVNSTNNPPIFLSGGTNYLKDLTLVSGAVAASIHATNAQNARIYGTVMATRNTNNLVSVITGTLNVDTDVE